MRARYGMRTSDSKSMSSNAKTAGCWESDGATDGSAALLPWVEDEEGQEGTADEALGDGEESLGADGGDNGRRDARGG